MPLGISFFTFHALSYLIDVSRGQVEAQKSPFRLALYISLFPQLVAGPIIRYGHVAHELEQRRHTVEDFAYGVCRFVIGLSKKVLIANVVGAIADQCFGMPRASLTPAQVKRLVHVSRATRDHSLLTPGFLAQEKPDVVVLESVERYWTWE